jgi:hypothetical protein
MTYFRESLFVLGAALSDASLEQRAAAAVDLILAEQVPLAERELLLLLTVAPTAFGEVNR